MNINKIPEIKHQKCNVKIWINVYVKSNKKLKWEKGLKKAFEEVGKHFLNIGVAIIVFAILQPIVKSEFSPKSSLIFAVVYLIIFTIAVFLITLGGREDE